MKEFYECYYCSNLTTKEKTNFVHYTGYNSETDTICNGVRYVCEYCMEGFKNE